MNTPNNISQTTKDFLNVVLKEIMALIHVECGSLFLCDAQNKELVMNSFYNGHNLPLKGLKQKIGEGVSGKVADIKIPVLVKDIDTDNRFKRNGYHHYRTKSFISIPIIHSQELLGLINLADKADGQEFSKDDLQAALTITKYACLTLDTHFKYTALQNEENTNDRQRFQTIVGKDEKMQKIYTLIEAIANTRANVLIHGESGTGKRLIAHAIHKYNEEERKKPFVEVSCGALTETLLESELFGHTKGSFTGAIKDRIGRFELANSGTIFLDEIDASSAGLQVKLLRVLQDGELERVGDTKTMTVDVRVIAATNQNLQELINQGKFRKDLYYRLNIISIDIPPLRERKGDIPLLVEEFIKKHSKSANKNIEGISSDALAVLTSYHWPGNVRELENVMERAIILSKSSVISPLDFPKSLHTAAQAAKPILENQKTLKLKTALESPEKDLILKTLNTTGWNRNETALLLDINRTTLYKKMQKYGLLKIRS